MSRKFDEEDTANLLCVSGVWYLRAMVNGVKIKQSLRTRSLQEAQQLRDERLGMLSGRRDEKSLLQSVKRQLAGIEQEEQDEARDKRQGKMISEALDMWEHDPARSQVSQIHYSQVKANWARFLEWLDKKHPEIKFCRQLTPPIGKEYSIDLYKTVGSNATFNRAISALRVVMACVCDIDDYLTDPFAKVKYIKANSRPREAFTDEELTKIFATENKEMRRLFALGLYTTQRLDVTRKLTWEHFSKDLAYLDVIHHKTMADGSMDVPPQLQEILMEVPPEERHGFICPTYAAYAGSSVSLVINRFLNSLGIQTSIEVIGINKKPRRKPLKGFHSLRHTAITFSLRNGSSVASVKRLAGHSKEAMQEHYSHLEAADAGKASELIGKFW